VVLNLLNRRVSKHKEITLSDVWSFLKKIQESVLSHGNMLTTIVSNTKNLKTSFKCFSSVVENLSKELVQVKKEKAVLSSAVKQLQEKICCLEYTTRVGTPIPEFDVFHEAHKRMLKDSKLMMFNVPLAANESPQLIPGLVGDNTVNDLGVTLDQELTFHYHIEKSFCKALKTLNIIKRVTNEFNLIAPLDGTLLL